MTRRHPTLFLLGVLAAGSLIACAGSYATPTSATPPRSGIEGRTMVDGGCPPMRDQGPCPDRPLRARLIVTQANTTQNMADTTSNTDGTFHIPLPPGIYTIHPANLTGAVTPIASPMTVTVTTDRFTIVTVHFDSGIR